MKKLLRFSVLIFIFSLLYGCGNKKVATIGYLNPASNRERFVKEGGFMAQRLSELGMETITLHAEDDDAIQLQQGYELLDRGVDVLVIACVNGNTIAPLVRDAMSKGVKVVAYNRLINNAEYDLFITGNNQDNARLFCEAVLSQRPSGNYVIFGGDRFDRNGLELKQHIDSILKPHIASGKINLLYETFIEGWSRDRAAFEFQQVIDAYGTDIDAVISCSDPMGLGVQDVLAKYGKVGEVIVTGQDATPMAVQAIYKGDMFMTIYHPHKTLGYKTAELIVEMLDGKRSQQLSNAFTFNGLKNIPTYQVNSIAVTKENLNQVLVESGEYSMKEIAN